MESDFERNLSLERKHLIGILKTVGRLKTASDEELTKAQSELASVFKYDRDNTDLLEVRQLLFERAEDLSRAMKYALNQPYFTRVDFIPKDADKEIIYIGKHSVIPEKSYEPLVHDWRAPIANLYYSGQVGPMRYETPDGTVEGELTLKRNFSIIDGRLESMFDSDIVSKDAYLQSVLSAASGDRLRDIVTSIQAEQNYVIRYPLKESLIVQGVAGSGKTTIALHRIAYLLYTYQETLRPEHVLILAPNRLFLNYIADVLPDLGVERVRQHTFAEYVYQQFGDLVPQLSGEDLNEHILNLDESRRRAMVGFLRFKGSREMVELINGWLDGVETDLPPGKDISFGPIKLYTADELRKFFLTDQKPFPLTRRIAEFKKDLTLRVTQGAQRLISWFQAETDKRCEKLRATLPPGEERRKRLVSLYDSRDQRIREIEERVKPFVKENMSVFPDLKAISMYKAFMKHLADTQPPQSRTRQCAEFTLDRLKSGSIDSEDIALVAMIAMRAYEIKRQDIRHIVIDEAQDLSYAEFALLKSMNRRSTMTIVGDLMQGIRSWRGVTDWHTLAHDLFDDKATRHTLLTSYRNTVEIMQLAFRVANHFPIDGQDRMKPVLRHGEEPRFMRYSNAEEQITAICDIISSWQRDSVRSVAVIERTNAALDRLLTGISARMPAHRLNVDDAVYVAGVQVAKASDIKGFEFDGVIMADVSDHSFGMSELDERLLFVCLTRPLHRLVCLYKGQLSPLFTPSGEHQDENGPQDQRANHAKDTE